MILPHTYDENNHTEKMQEDDTNSQAKYHD